jgi:hypothetical protein
MESFDSCAADALRIEGCSYVEGGATVSGGRGDAVLQVDLDEHRRRQAHGLGAVTDLWTLDRLLCLPFALPVADTCLSAEDEKVVRIPGVAAQTSEGFLRVIRPVAEVRFVVIRATQWRSGIRRAAAFEPFARRILLLPAYPREVDRLLWEADLLGIGVRVGTVGDSEQLVAAEPWKARYAKSAGWRFMERAYDAWLKAVRVSEPESGSSGRPGRLTAATAGQLL